MTTHSNETDITYHLGFVEAYRGDQREGSLYGGNNEPKRGFIWDLSQWHTIDETDDTLTSRNPFG